MPPKTTFGRRAAGASTSGSSARAPRFLLFIVTSAITKPAPLLSLPTYQSRFPAATSSCPNPLPDRPRARLVQVWLTRIPSFPILRSSGRIPPLFQGEFHEPSFRPGFVLLRCPLVCPYRQSRHR